MKQKKLLFFIFILFFIKSNAQWQYAGKAPLNLTTGISIKTVCFPVADTGYILQDQNNFFITHNGGVTWTKGQLPSTKSMHVQNICFTSGTVGYACGSSVPDGFLRATIYKTIDGGKTWNLIYTSTNAATYFYHITKVSPELIFATGDAYYTFIGNTGTITGFVTLPYFYPTDFSAYNDKISVGYYKWLTSDSTEQCKALKSLDGGKTWTSINFPSTYNSIYYIHFNDVNNGYAIVFRCARKNETYGKLSFITTNDGGTTWSFLNEAVNSSAYYGLTGTNALAIGRANNRQGVCPSLSTNNFTSFENYQGIRKHKEAKLMVENPTNPFIYYVTDSGYVYKTGNPLNDAYVPSFDFSYGMSAYCTGGLLKTVNMGNKIYTYEWYYNNTLISKAYDTSYQTPVSSETLDKLSLKAFYNGKSDVVEQLVDLHDSIFRVFNFLVKDSVCSNSKAMLKIFPAYRDQHFQIYSGSNLLADSTVTQNKDTLTMLFDAPLGNTQMELRVVKSNNCVTKQKSSFFNVFTRQAPNQKVTTQFNVSTACVGDTVILSVLNSLPQLQYKPDNGMNTSFVTGNNSTLTFKYVYQAYKNSYDLIVKNSPGICPFQFIKSTPLDNSCDVWPGDSDNNLIVDNYDLLPIGLYYGTKGNKRTNATLNWNAQPCVNWTTFQKNTFNTKHIDCNGDGTINAADTLALYTNFNAKHTYPFLPDVPTSANETLPKMYWQTNKSTYLPGDWVTADLYIGDSTLPVTLYGIAFNVNYGSTPVVAGSERVTFPTSFFARFDILNNALKFSKAVSADRTVYAAVTVFTKGNGTGYGKIATLQFQLSNSASWTDSVELSISKYKAVDLNENSILFKNTPYKTSITKTVTVNEQDKTINAITVYPNPFTTIATINYNLTKKSTVKIILYNASGQQLETVINSEQKQGEYTIPLNMHEKGYGEGIYFIKLIAGETIIVKKIIQMH